MVFFFPTSPPLRMRPGQSYTQILIIRFYMYEVLRFRGSVLHDGMVAAVTNRTGFVDNR